MAQNKVKAIALTSFDTSGISGSYQSINPSGLDQACFQVNLHNHSNISVLISYDGVTDNEFLLASEALNIAAQTNAQPNGYVALFGKGQQIYVKQVTAGAGVGSVYVSGYYVAP